MEMIHKVRSCKVLDAPKGKPIVAVVSTQERDVDNDVIYQGPSDKGRGWLLDKFNARGGRVYWMHNPWIPNLAKASARVDSERLLLSVEFDLEDQLAATLDRKIRAGYLDEWSVGFIPSEKVPNEAGGFDIYEAELWEVSVVNQGANEATGVLAKGFYDAADVLKLYDDRLRNVESMLMREQRVRAEREQKAIASAIEVLSRNRIFA